MENMTAEERKKPKIPVALSVCAGVILAILLFLLIFALQKVEVTGNSYYTDEEILAFLGYEEDTYQNSILFCLRHDSRDIDELPYAQNISLKLSAAGTVTACVTEKTIAGCFWSGDTYVYVDTEGIICEVSSICRSDVLVLSGITFTDTQVGQAPVVENDSMYQGLLQLALLLTKYAIEVDEASVSDNFTYCLTISHITVMLGYSTDMEDKISALPVLLEQIDEYEGVLHMENYDTSSDSVVFTKES